MVDPVTAKGADYGDVSWSAATVEGAERRQRSDEMRMGNGHGRRTVKSVTASYRAFLRVRNDAATRTSPPTQRECVAPADERRFALATGDVDLEDALREPWQRSDDAASHASMADVMPVLVARSIGRPNSSARIAAIWLCCHAPME